MCDCLAFLHKKQYINSRRKSPALESLKISGKEWQLKIKII